MRRVFLFLMAALALGPVHAMSVEDEKIELERCKAAGDNLRVNSAFVLAAVGWRYDQLPVQRFASRQEQIASMTRVSQAPFESMRGDGSLDGKMLQRWFNSPYCRSLLRNYQDYVVANYSRSLVNKSTREISCEAFGQQYRLTYLSDAAVYRNPLAAGLRETIKDSIYRLNGVQKNHVLSVISSNGLQAFAQEVDEYCHDGAVLSSSLAEVPTLELVESGRSLEIQKEFDSAKRTGCGSLKDVYCLDDIRQAAYQEAHDTSVECDRKDSRTGDCALDARQLMAAFFQRAESQKLKDEIRRHERYVNNPVGSGDFNSANASGNIERIAEDCKQGAIAQGLRNQDYRKYADEVCMPQAKARFVAPEAAVLKRLKARLSEVDGRAVPAPVANAAAKGGQVARAGGMPDKPASQPSADQQRFAAVDAELNKVYRSVMSSLGPEQKTALKQEQIQWIRKKEGNCGSDVECQSEMTEARLSYLKAYRP